MNCYDCAFNAWNVEPPPRLIHCETCAAAHDAVVGRQQDHTRAS